MRREVLGFVPDVVLEDRDDPGQERLLVLSLEALDGPNDVTGRKEESPDATDSEQDVGS